MIALGRLCLMLRCCVAAALLSLLSLLSLSACATPVEANSASAAELESIKGIGPRMAANISTERRSASFRDWADLIDRVQGIGPGSASKFSTHGLTVNGAHYSTTAAAPGAAGKQHRSTASSGRGVIMTVPQPTVAPPQLAPPTRSTHSVAQRKPAPRPSSFSQAH